MNNTAAIFGKRALEQISAIDYIDWAGEMLERRLDSPSLRILAGFERSSFVSLFEVENYFRRSLKELHIAEPGFNVAIREYACEIAQKIVNNQIEAKLGLKLLYKICLKTEYDSDFIIWLELDDALDYLLAEEFPYTYPTVTLINFDNVLKFEAKKFISEMQKRISKSINKPD